MAANQGDAAAQYNLGVCYYNGEGVTQNKTEAARLFRLAAAQGDEDAKKALKRLGLLTCEKLHRHYRKQVINFITDKKRGCRCCNLFFATCAVTVWNKPKLNDSHTLVLKTLPPCKPPLLVECGRPKTNFY